MTDTITYNGPPSAKRGRKPKSTTPPDFEAQRRDKIRGHLARVDSKIVALEAAKTELEDELFGLRAERAALSKRMES